MSAEIAVRTGVGLTEMVRVAAGAGVGDGGDDCGAGARVALAAAFVGDFNFPVAVLRRVGPLPG